MTDSAKKTLTPKLRFPEFRGEAEWETKALATFLKEAGERVPSDTDLPIYSSTRTGLKRQDDYYDGRLLLNKNDYGVVPAGCFVYRHMSDDGLFKFNINDTGGGIAVSKEYPVFRAVNLDPIFLLSKLNYGADFEEFALSQKAGGTRTRLYFSKLSTWKTAIPSLAEQQKIAECLSTLDELIGAESQKLDALKAHKKGLMQQLFPREGETLPRLRFPEFHDAPEWDEKRLDQLVSFQSGGTPSKANPAFWNGSFPWVSAKDMKQLFLIDTEDHISAAAVDDGAKLVPCGTLLMLVRGMTLLKDVPICVVRRKMSFNQDVKALHPVDGVDGLFLALLLTGAKDRLLEMVTVAGHGTGKLDTDELKAMALMLPSRAEQQRIASCLSSLDDLIAAQSNQLEALKTHKKGLMQQLFPSPAEAAA